MSAVDDLRQTLVALASDCEQTAGALAEFKENFSDQADQVQGLIGNTATGADQAIAQRYERAKSAVDEAVAALAAASQESTDYAAGL